MKTDYEYSLEKQLAVANDQLTRWRRVAYVYGIGCCALGVITVVSLAFGACR